LADKFWSLVRAKFPKIDYVGYIKFWSPGFLLISVLNFPH
jgi:hypothetical protein